MQVFNKIKDLKKYITDLKEQGNLIGFVPTMGALHKGHLTLIKNSLRDNDITVVSIFVNPIQFNNKKDLIAYPRDLQRDILKLDKNECDIVFCPEDKEIYPEPINEKYDLGGLDMVMEGKFRPGHFQGVAIVVKRLLDIVTPDNAYFGKKDFQQLTIIKYLVKSLRLPVKIIGCETLRENDGLAMSSRNQLLDKELRSKAAIIPLTLFKCKELKSSMEIEQIKSFVEKTINEPEGLKLEYFEIVEKDLLHPVNSWNDKKDLVACIAVWAGNVRLIDNISI